VVKDWVDNKLHYLPHGKTFIVAFGSKSLKMSTNNHSEVPELHSAQEEADTRMLLHILHGTSSTVPLA
jgi:hypothetical protein